MPTQVPPGSAMAVKKVSGGGGRRRVKPRGPRLLKYADGGMVRNASKMIEATGRLFGTEKAKAIDAAEREARDMKEGVTGHVAMKKEMVVMRKATTGALEEGGKEAASTFKPVGAGGHGARARRLEEMEEAALK